MDGVGSFGNDSWKTVLPLALNLLTHLNILQCSLYRNREELLILIIHNTCLRQMICNHVIKGIFNFQEIRVEPELNICIDPITP